MSFFRLNVPRRLKVLRIAEKNDTKRSHPIERAAKQNDVITEYLCYTRDITTIKTMCNSFSELCQV